MMEIYPDNFENKIKFDRIRQLITANCLSITGQNMVKEMHFLVEENNIRAILDETAEFMAITQEGDFPAGRFDDIKPMLARIKIEGLYPEISDLIILRTALESLADVTRFFEGKAERFPKICARAAEIQSFPYILQRLNSILTKFGSIKDNASPELADIRRRKISLQSGISRRMQSFLQQAQSEGWTDKDAGVAIRDGRMVIPITSAYKRRINGIVHDESTTGKTSYIEPTEIVETNNEIRELELEEKREINRILLRFADDVRPYTDALIPGFDFLTYTDFLRAKSLFALSINACIPLLSGKPEMFWYEARHPLLQLAFKNTDKKLIPLKLIIDEEQRIILISGPNAGGKSVCLQTAGLLQYMLQCGIPVPVSEASKFGIFKRILIDMGDEQSIENDLSTYSSHLINMRNFLKYADSQTLILIDEFGSGTEPIVGGALAEAILNALNQKEAKGVITTHYTCLKNFASETKGIENGAMLYDTQLMTPLFQLQIGKPGSSFAFEIAKKIGMPKEILQEASQKAGEELINYDRHLQDIARDKHYWEEKRKKIHINEKRLDEVVEKYSNELKEASQLRKEILAEAKSKAADILANANRVIENTIREIRENQAEKEKTRIVRQHLEEEKQQILSSDNDEEERIKRKMEKIKNRQERKKEKKVEDSSSEPKKNTPEKPLQKGDYVLLPNKAHGEILEINGNKAIIALGNLRTTIPLSDLKRSSVSQSKKAIAPATSGTWTEMKESISQKRLDFKPEIDVRGMRGDEALQHVIDFIDNAVMLNYTKLRILHGTGTGALREIIRQYLRTNPVVGSFHDEHIQFGGSGITVIELDI